MKKGEGIVAFRNFPGNWINLYPAPTVSLGI